MSNRDLILNRGYSILATFQVSRFTMFLFVLAASLSLDLDLLFAASFGLADRVVEQKLTNGLTILMVERHQTPVVSLNMTFGVGGVNEQVGQTGLAHLYEHMAFKGTRTVGTKDYEKERPILEEWYRVGTELEQRQRELARKSQERPASPEDRAVIEELQKRFTELQEKAGQFVASNEMALLYQRHGGVGLNAATGKDLTRYMISLPANRLPLWAVVEADRMAHPVLREFYKERGVVMEERRMRNDDSPSGLLFETFTSAAFRAHPYGIPTIGWESDILSLTPADTEAFFKVYYGPGNATIDLPAVSPGLLQVTDVTGACELRVYPATDAEAIRFNQTGALPASWFGCSNRTVTTSGQVAHLILLNVASFSIPYEINVVAYSVSVPLGRLALPATALVLLGLIGFLPRMMAEEIMRFRDEFGRPKKRR